MYVCVCVCVCMWISCFFFYQKWWIKLNILASLSGGYKWGQLLRNHPQSECRNSQTGWEICWLQKGKAVWIITHQVILWRWWFSHKKCKDRPYTTVRTNSFIVFIVNTVTCSMSCSICCLSLFIVKLINSFIYCVPFFCYRIYLFWWNKDMENTEKIRPTNFASQLIV